MLSDLRGHLHAQLSKTLLIPLAEKQWVARRSRAGMAAARTAGIKFRVAAEGWNQAQKQAHVLTRLQEVLRHAQRHSPYYRRVFSTIGFNAEDDFGFSDFGRLPILERGDVIRYERDLIADDIAPGRSTQDSTGGSTGQPVRVWLGPQENGWRVSGAAYYHRRVGVVPGAKTALLWGHNLDPVARRTLKDRVVGFVHNYRWFDCFRLSTAILEMYHAELQRWRPDYIIAYAGALGSLAEFTLDRGYKTAYPRVCCITGAEKLFPRQRRLVEQAFGKVHERYGGRDVGLIALQLDCTDPTFDIDWANLLVEPETAEPESAVLVTKLNADGMPMIRYRVGDLASFPEGSAPGHPVFQLREVLGRCTDRVWLPSGQWIHGIQLPHLMRDYPVREFMLTQQPDYALDLLIVPAKGFGETHRQAIQSVISANLSGLPLRITLVPTIERTRAGKLRPVVSEVGPRNPAPLIVRKGEQEIIPER